MLFLMVLIAVTIILCSRVDPPEDPDNYVLKLERTTKLFFIKFKATLIEDHEEAFVCEKRLDVPLLRMSKILFSK